MRKCAVSGCETPQLDVRQVASADPDGTVWVWDVCRKHYNDLIANPSVSMETKPERDQ